MLGVTAHGAYPRLSALQLRSNSTDLHKLQPISGQRETNDLLCRISKLGPPTRTRGLATSRRHGTEWITSPEDKVALCCQKM